MKKYMKKYKVIIDKYNVNVEAISAKEAIAVAGDILVNTGQCSLELFQNIVKNKQLVYVEQL